MGGNIRDYQAIDEISANTFLLLGLGGMVVILSGIFVINGGADDFFALFMGIAPAFAVAAETNQVVASSFSGSLAHFWTKSLNLKTSNVLLSWALSRSPLRFDL